MEEAAGPQRPVLLDDRDGELILHRQSHVIVLTSHLA